VYRSLRYTGIAAHMSLLSRSQPASGIAPANRPPPAGAPRSPPSDAGGLILNVLMCPSGD
jgi:hypothetical protein